MKCNSNVCIILYNSIRKDKDIESKKGGLDALFRDGIPLNEDFLALKNKYKKEQKELEMEITNLEKQISDIESSNEETTKKVDIIQDEYDQLSKEKDKGSNFIGNKERE